MTVGRADRGRRPHRSGVFYRAPLYPYFLGALYTITGHSLLIVRVCEAAIGTTSSVLLALTAHRLSWDRAGLIAGLGLAVYAPSMFFNGLLQRSVLDCFLFLSCSGLSVSRRRTERTLPMVLFGV